MNEKTDEAARVVRQLVEAMLSDDFGVSQTVYNQMLLLSRHFTLSDILSRTAATDGRYYIPE